MLLKLIMSFLHSTTKTGFFLSQKKVDFFPFVLVLGLFFLFRFFREKARWGDGERAFALLGAMIGVRAGAPLIPNEFVRSMPTPALNESFDLGSHQAERPAIIDVLEFSTAKFTLRAMVIY